MEPFVASKHSPPSRDPAVGPDADAALPLTDADWTHFEPLRLVVDVAERNGSADPSDDRILDVVVDGIRCVLLVDRNARRERLSPREREIARLVARGCTNRTIASLLDISLWTVSTHMRRIFAKLDVTTRAAMVAAVEAGARLDP